MATIQDIFDWLNQGAQGDIPGTDPSLPGSPSQTAQPQQQQQQPPPPPSPPPDGSQGGEQQQAQKGAQAGQKAGQGLWAMLFGKQPQKTPGDYSGDIPPTLLMHYQDLISQGIPPAVAHSILTQPSLGEGESPAQAGYSAQPYAGEEQDKLAGKFDFPAEPPIGEQMWSAREAQQQNLPVAEGQTQGSSSGLQQLPTGQYVPYPSQGLDYWAAQGNPSSFYWNPQPGSSWLSDLLGGQ